MLVRLGNTHRAAAIATVAVLATARCTCNSGGGPTAPVVDRSHGEIPHLRASHVAAGTIHIDGRMDEPVWRTTGSTRALVNPGDGRAARASRVQGEARIVWDDENLYVGATVNDGDPSSPFRPSDEDPHLWERSSAIEVMIQPGDPGDNRGYYEIQVDVNGAVWDTQFDDYNRPISGDGPARRFGHQEWRSELRQSVRVERGTRYTVEIAIPWRTLQSTRTAVPPHAGDVWRVNVYSFRDGQSDSLAWSPLLGQGNFHFAPRFGRVEF